MFGSIKRIKKASRAKWSMIFPLLILVGSSLIFGLTVATQTQNLNIRLKPDHLKTIFQIYSLIFIIVFFMYRWIESFLFSLCNGKYVPVILNQTIFFSFISAILVIRASVGLTTLVDLPTLLVFVMFRLTTSYLNLEQIDTGKANYMKLIKYIPTFTIWFIGIYLFVLVNAHGDFNGLMWESNDGRHFKWLADKLTLIRSEKSYFEIGLPLIMTPFNILSGAYNSRSLDALLVLNNYLIIFFTFIVWPISIILFQKAIFLALRISQTVLNTTAVGIILMFVNLLYMYFVPKYATEHDALTHPVLILGLVPAVEIVHLFFMSVSLYALVAYKKVGIVFVGLVAGFAVITKATNWIPVGLFFASFFLLKGNKMKALKTFAVVLLVFSIQLSYAYWNFGGGFYPGREYQNERKFEENDSWREYISENYNLKVEDVKFMDTQFISRNFSLTISHYFIPLMLAGFSFFLLMWKRLKQWNLWTYSISVIIIFWMVHTTFIRLGATFRYYHLLVFPFAFLLISAGHTLYKLYRKQNSTN